MLNLRNIFELVNDGFDHGAFAQQVFVFQQHQVVAHVASELGDQSNALGFELSRQIRTEIAPVSKHLSKSAIEQLRNGVPVIHIARREPDIEEFAPVVDR
jgi:hypothetical protein